MSEDYVIAQIDHADGTLYFANHDIHMDDTHFYEGRLDIGELRQALPGLLDTSAAPFASLALNLTLGNRSARDTVLNDLLIPGVTGWANKAVRLYTARTNAPRVFANYTCRFEGKIRFPEGMSRTERLATFMVDDLRTRDRTNIPKTFVASGDPISVIYGAFEDPYRIGMKDQKESPYKLAAHTMEGFDGLFYKDESDAINIEIEEGSLDIASSPSTVEIPRDWHIFKTLDAGYSVESAVWSAHTEKMHISITHASSNHKVIEYDGKSWEETYSHASVKVTYEGDGLNRLYRLTDDGKCYRADANGDFSTSEKDFSPEYAVHCIGYKGYTFFICNDGDVWRRSAGVYTKVRVGTGAGVRLACGNTAFGFQTDYIFAVETGKIIRSSLGSSWADISAPGSGDIQDAVVRDQSELVMIRGTTASKVWAYNMDDSSWNDGVVIIWYSSSYGGYIYGYGVQLCAGPADRLVYIGIKKAGVGYSALLSWNGSSLATIDGNLTEEFDELLFYRRNEYDYICYCFDEVVHASSQNLAWSDMTFLCRGKMVIGGSDLLNHPPEIIDDILRDLCGVTTGEIDAASWVATLDVIKPGSSTYRIHGVIDSVVDSHDQIQEICRDCGLICGVKLPSVGATTSKYFLDHWKRSVSADASHIDVTISDPVESEDCDLYLNRITGSHKLIPWSGDFAEVLEIENASAISQDGVERPFELASRWRFDGSNDHIPFTTYINNLLNTFSKHVQMQTCGIGGGFWYELAQKLHLTWNYLTTETPFRILERTLSFLSNQATYRGWNQRTMWEHPDMFWGTQNGEAFYPESYPAKEQVAPSIPVPLHGRRIRMFVKVIRAYVMFKVVGDFAGSPLESNEFGGPYNGGIIYDGMLEVDISGVAVDTYATVEIWASKVDDQKKIWDVVLDMVD